jgi:hypothetical protein
LNAAIVATVIIDSIAVIAFLEPGLPYAVTAYDGELARNPRGIATI